MAAGAEGRGGSGRIVDSAGAGRRVAPDEPAEPRPTVSANLALRLIQLHLLVIYGMAGLGKLQGPSWWNGMALWGTMTAGEFVVFDFTPMARWPLAHQLPDPRQPGAGIALSDLDLDPDHPPPDAGRHGGACTWGSPR